MRVKLDLSEFLEDERKFSVVKVKEKQAKTVRDVLIKIADLFNVDVGIQHSDDPAQKPTVGLFEDEFYIHPDQTSAVLQDTGVLRVKSLPKPGSGKKKKKSKRDHTEEDNVAKDVSDRKERKSKKGKSDEEFMEIQNDVSSEEKKEKRGSRIFEECQSLENEDDGNRKARKRKRGKTTEDAGGVEMSDLEQRAKNSRMIEELSDSEDELLVKQKGKSKKVKFSEPLIIEDEDVEEVYSKKKGKKSKLKVDDAELAGEVEEVTLPRKKKSKREKATESPFPSEPVVEKRMSVEYSPIQEHKASRKKGDRSLSVEELAWVQGQQQSEIRRNRIREEKISQEKVVSTSTIINLESEDVAEDSLSSSSSIESFQVEHQALSKAAGFNSKHYVVDSVTDPLMVDEPLFKAKRRKRKHKKKNKNGRELEEKDEINVSHTGITVEKYNKPSTSTDMQRYPSYQWPGSNQRPLLNSSFTRKHVHFTSDDEVTPSGIEKTPSQDIEIVETTTTTLEDDRFEAESFPGYQWRNKSKSQSVDSWPSRTASFPRNRNMSRITCNPAHTPVDVEAEDKYERNEIFLSRHKGPPQVLSKTPTSSSSNLDELATLRRICENKTITVCKVDTRKEQTRIRPKETSSERPSPLSHHLDPPSPLRPGPRRVDEETRQTFQNIMAMQNNSTQILARNPRQVVQLEDSDTTIFPRHRGPDLGSSVQEVNNKSPGKMHSPENRKTNGEELHVIPSFQNVSPRNPAIHQKIQSQQAGQRGKEGQTSQQDRDEEWKETRTTKLLSSILNEATQRGSSGTPQSRSKEMPRRTHQPSGVGALISSLRGQVGSSVEMDGGDLEILGNDKSTTSALARETLVNRQVVAERLTKVSEPLHNMQTPGTSTVKYDSPARLVNQNVNMATVPLRVESEVVDLESEEEIEIPVTKTIEHETADHSESLNEETVPQEPKNFIPNQQENKSISDNIIAKTVPLEIGKPDSCNRTDIQEAEVIQDEQKPPQGTAGRDHREGMDVVEDVIEYEEEELEVEEEEEDVGLEEEECYDTRWGEVDEDGAEVIEDDEEEDMTDIYGDLIDEGIDDNAKVQGTSDIDKEIGSRLKECLEKISEVPPKCNLEDVKGGHGSEKVAGIMTGQNSKSETNNFSLKSSSERTVDVNASSNNKDVINIAEKAQGESGDKHSVAEVHQANGKELTTFQESRTLTKEAEEEEVAKKDEEKSPGNENKGIEEVRANETVSTSLRSPSPEVIQVTPAIPPNKVPATQIHTLIQHTTVTNIVPNMVPTPALVPAPPPPPPLSHHPQIRAPLAGNSPSQSNFTANPQSLFMSLPPQYSLNQLINQTLYNNMSAHNFMPGSPLANAAHLSSFVNNPSTHHHHHHHHRSHPSSSLYGNANRHSTSSQQNHTPNLHGMAALVGSPLQIGSTLTQHTQPVHPLLGMPLTNPRPRAGIFQRPPALHFMNPFLAFQRFPN
ncbi:hypothetical protein Pmani_037062 [Petrolisthes manimaculis]|uniref:Uncharacterized protein n=1 Tax=Petrolisthes manimaculis TaxID=1843537 RepID=A0AAE1TNR2_9EUCA|nr:hypothetical protein Pmani_037062 [Petrolisthes manimaculis]